MKSPQSGEKVKKSQTKEIKKSNRTQIAFPFFKSLLGDDKPFVYALQMPHCKTGWVLLISPIFNWSILNTEDSILARKARGKGWNFVSLTKKSISNNQAKLFQVSTMASFVFMRILMEISAASRLVSAMVPKMLAEICYCRGLGHNCHRICRSLAVFAWRLKSNKLLWEALE